MPGSTRQWAQRKLDSSTNNLDYSLAHIEDVVEMYKHLHPEVSEPLEGAQAAIVLAHQVVAKVRGSI